MLAAWQLAVTVRHVPPYLVPSPILVAQTLYADRTLLLHSLGVTLGIALTALGLATLARRRDRAAVRAEPLAGDEPVPVRHPAAGHADRVDRAADHHLGARHAHGAGALRDRRRRSSRSFRTRHWVCAASIAGSSTCSGLRAPTRWQTLWRLRAPSALPYFFGGLRIASGLSLIGAVVAEFVAGTGGQGAGLAYQILLAGIQLNIPAPVRGPRADRARRRRAFRATVGLSRLALSRWHESAMPVDADGVVDCDDERRPVGHLLPRHRQLRRRRRVLAACTATRRRACARRHAVDRSCRHTGATSSPQSRQARDAQSSANVIVRRLDDDAAAPALPGMVVEGFGCGLPARVVDAMAAATVPPLWINLEYLSAEPWVDTAHGLASAHPRLPLTRHFWFPGFTRRTGGLIREAGLLAASDAWRMRGRRRDESIAHRVVLLCRIGRFPALFDAWAEGPTSRVTCLVPEGVVTAAARSLAARGCSARGAGGGARPADPARRSPS